MVLTRITRYPELTLAAVALGAKAIAVLNNEVQQTAGEQREDTITTMPVPIAAAGANDP
jgi:hypothetical protein